MKHFLQIKNLSLFINRLILDGISFDLKRGEIVGIVGESGSGKSLTAVSILRLLNRDAFHPTGDILFDGESLLLKSEKEMDSIRGKKIGFIPQDPMTSLNPTLTIGVQLVETLRHHLGLNLKQAWSKATKILEVLGIKNAEVRMLHYPHEFSGGERQRILIGIALSCEPEFLIADEPTTALDVTLQIQILQLIKEQQLKSNLGVILISHDLAVIAKICDRVIVMKEGKVIEQGTVNEILQNPKQDYTKTLIEAKHVSFEKKKMSDKNAKTIVEIRNITKHYESKKRGLLNYFRFKLDAKAPSMPSLKDVSLTIYPGEIFGLVGESGSGKSTLAKTLLCLIEPNQGSVIFNEKSLTSMSSKELLPYRKRIQIVFQSPYSSLNPKMRIRDILVEPLKIHNLAGHNKDEKLNELLTAVKLPIHLLDYYPSQISGGQRQRVCIARALAVEPDLLICDEPLSALDAMTQIEVVKLLQQIQKKMGLTILFISHDLALMRRLTDRIAIMQKGEIIEIGDTEEIFNNPRHDYTKALLSAALTL